MKTPTLIVRLAGLYLLIGCSLNLMQIRQAQSLAGPNGIGVQQQSIMSNMQLSAVVGLIAGIAAALFAGPLARLLTFDSEPRKEELDLSDRFLRTKNDEA